MSYAVHYLDHLGRLQIFGIYQSDTDAIAANSALQYFGFEHHQSGDTAAREQKSKLARFVEYFTLEDRIIGKGDIPYQICYTFIDVGLQRIRTFIAHESELQFDGSVIVPEHFKAIKYSCFLQDTAKVVRAKSQHHSPMMGSVPESIQERYLELADELIALAECEPAHAA